MALVDYSVIDPDAGLYEFRDDTGRARMAYGSEADELARFVDQTRKARPLTAQNMSGGEPAMSSMDAGSSTMPAPPPPQQSDVGPQMSAAPDPVASQAPPVAGPPASIARPDMLPSPAQAAQQVALSGEPQTPGISAGAVIEHATRPRWSGGRPEFDPAKYDASLAPVRTGGSAAVQGALPETPEQAAQRLEDEKRRRSAFETALTETQAAQEERVAAHEEAKYQHQLRALDAQDEIKAREQRLAQIEANGKRVMAGLEADRANIRNMKVDPRRLFRTKSGSINPATVIMSAIAQGLGAFGAGMTGTRNFAADLIDGAIQRDVSIQESERESETERADNALGRFERFYNLDRSEARMALEISQRDYAAAQASALAASIGTAEAKAQAATLVADLMARNAQTEAALREAYGGRVTTQEQVQYMAPRAASRGGYRPATDKEIQEGIKTGLMLQELTGERMDPDQIKAQAEARTAQNQEDKNVQEYGKRRSDIATARTVLHQYVESMGGSIDEQGKVKWREMDIPDTGPIAGRTPAFSAEAKKVARLRNWLGTKLGQAISGATVSDQQMESIEKKLASTNEDAAREGAEELLKELDDAEVNIDASFGPGVVTQFIENEDQTKRLRRERSDAQELTPAGKIRLGGSQ